MSNCKDLPSAGPSDEYDELLAPFNTQPVGMQAHGQHDNIDQALIGDSMGRSWTEAGRGGAEAAAPEAEGGGRSLSAATTERV